MDALEDTLCSQMDLVDLFDHLNKLCATAAKPVVLMIDEVDSASNNQVFLDFLAQLRDAYLDREDTPTFQSAILFNGKRFPYNPDNHSIDIGIMFGFVKEEGIVAVSNRIFATRLYNLFMSEDLMDNETDPFRKLSSG